ncbi:MAG: nucleoside monophosphate kinase [Silvanigrellaceae bacterium]|nr:nucleoside monophosphate kinase [Silvanigrellaceae bacterium]
MKVVILLGPPGVGKGTQASMLVARLGAIHISTGVLVRNEIASGSKLGRKVKNIVDAGFLVSDDVIFDCLEKELTVLAPTFSEHEYIFFDGMPRNLSQAQVFDSVIGKFGLKLDVVVAIIASLEDLISRLSNRLICSECGAINSSSGNPLNEVVCVKCMSKGTMTRRKDDDAEVVKQRFGIYDAETSPLLSFYKSREQLYVVNGLMSPEEVYSKITTHLFKI